MKILKILSGIWLSLLLLGYIALMVYSTGWLFLLGIGLVIITVLAACCMSGVFDERIR